MYLFRKPIENVRYALCNQKPTYSGGVQLSKYYLWIQYSAVACRLFCKNCTWATLGQYTIAVKYVLYCNACGRSNTEQQQFL